MVLIFFFSSQNGEESQGLSNRVVVYILKIFVPSFDSLTLESQKVLISRYSYVVRKAAHFSEYLMLAFSFSSYLSTGEKVMRYSMRGAVSFVFSVIYSITDEAHQFFSDGRSPAVMDVVIDSSGAALGIGISLLLFFIIAGTEKNTPV